MAESCNIWLISDIHDVMYVAGAGRVLGLSWLNLHGPQQHAEVYSICGITLY